ncbi:hypothetical protein [Streptomyces sodiiphilus]
MEPTRSKRCETATTEIYIQRLDVHRIYQELYESAGRNSGLAVVEA